MGLNAPHCELCGDLIVRRRDESHARWRARRFCCRSHGQRARHTPRGVDYADAFWRLVQKGERCWLWTGPTNPDGYGTFKYHGQRRLAHRVAYELTHGLLAPGQCVLHHCDNPPCCNAEKCLFIGTRAVNNADREAKGRGRHPAGAEHPRGAAKLSATQATAIRQSRESGLSLAARYGVSRSTVNRIRRGEAWKTEGDR